MSDGRERGDTVQMDAVGAPTSETLAPFAPGTTVGHFRIMRAIGQGGMGEVLLARDLRLGRKVALKVVNAKELDSPEMLERFMVEARVIARFNHPHIVTLFEVGEHGGRPYLALEYLRGEDLGSRLRQGSMRAPEAMRIALAVAGALAEAHRNGVLHRDLKPGNVMIGRDGRVRVLDFGLAKTLRQRPSNHPATLDDDAPLSIADELTQDSELFESETYDERSFGFGTPHYISPEQWRDAPASTATDMWALGVLIYAMLAHRLPFPHRDMDELARAVTREHPPPIDEQPSLDPTLEELVAQLLSKDPATRPSAKETAATLEGLLQRGAQRRRGGDNPFRGLRPFDADHAALFFGRDAEIASFVERVRVQPILPVLGPSGAGKSSLLRAGVIPRLREQAPWLVLDLRPGARPFRALAHRLLRAYAKLSLEGSSSRGLGPSLRSDKSRRSDVSLPRGRPSSPRSESRRSDSGPSDDSDVTRVEAAPDEAVTVPVRPAVELDAGGADTASPASDDAQSIAALAASLDVDDLTVDGEAVAETGRLLRSEPRRLGVELRSLAERSQAKVLLLVDQMEELFTLCRHGGVRAAFLEALCEATDDELDPVRVIFTARDDYLGRLATGSRMRDVLSRVVVVQQPDERALLEMLERPVELAGHGYDDPTLVKSIVDAVEGEPACLPLVQFTAHQLWERRDKDKRLLTRQAYEAMGGVEGALARHADGLVDGLTAERLGHARRLLLSMVTPERTRRVVTKEQALEGMPKSAAELLGQLTEARLVTSSKVVGEEGVETVLELAHESLISRWTRLSRWIDEGREDMLFLADVSQAASLWDRRGRDAHELWQGDALRECLRSMERLSNEAPALVREFVEASKRREEQRVRRKRLGLVTTALVLIGVAAGATALALFVRAQRDVARDREADALREGARAALAQGDVLQARAKLRQTLEGKDSTAARALWWQLSAEPQLWRERLGSPTIAPAISADGRWVAAATQDGPVYLFDAVTGRAEVLRGHGDQAIGLAFSPDGRRLAAGGLDKTVRVWAIPGGALKQTLRGHESGVHGVAFAPNGQRIVAGGYDGTARVFDLESGDEVLNLRGHEAAVRGVAFSPDGKWIATASSDRTARLWDATSGETIRSFVGHDREVYTVAFHPDGEMLATSAYDGLIRLFDVSTGKLSRTLRGHRSGVALIGFDGEGKWLASASTDRTVRLWDVDRGEQVWVAPHESQVMGVAISTAGDRLASTTAAGDVTLFDLTAADIGSERDELVGGHGAVVSGAALSANGDVVASGGFDGRVLLWDAESGRVRKELIGHNDGVMDVAFAPEGMTLVSASKDRTARIWDAASGEPGPVLVGHQAEVVALDLRAGLVLSGSYDQTARLWAVDDGATKLVLDGQTDRVRGVAIAPDGERVAVSSYDRKIRIWDRDGELSTTLEGHEHRVYGVAFSPDGEQLVSASYDTTLRLWNLEDGSHRVLARHDARVYGVAFHPDGRRVGVASADGKSRIYTLDEEPAVVVLEGHRNEVNSVRFDAEGKRVVTASDDGTVRLYDADDGRPLWRSALLHPGKDGGPSRVLTHAGWSSFDGEPAERPDAPWVEALEEGASAAWSPDGAWLCVADGSEVALWRGGGTRVGETAQDPVDELVASDAGCLVRSGGRATLVTTSGEAVPLAAENDVQALGRSDDGILLATATRVLRYGADGSLRDEHPIGGGVSALAFADGQLLVGYVDGNLDARPFPPANGVEALGGGSRFDEVPASPVTLVMAGPKGTVVAGYANGLLGLWDRSHGIRLAKTQLHGPIVDAHLIAAGGGNGALLATSELGHYASWDMGPFYQPYCELLRDVWARIPVIWREGHAQMEPAPRDHACPP